MPDRIFERKERIVGANRTYGLAAEVSELPEDGLETLICLLLDPIGRRCQPFEPRRQRRCDHQDLICGIDQTADPERKLIRTGD
jgi:hypothetical protein